MLQYFDFPVINDLWKLLFIGWGVVNIFWCLQMQKALVQFSRKHEMHPPNVWLVYIPLFGFFWQFLVTKAVADSLGEEYFTRGIIPREAKPGYSSGLSSNILFCCAIIPAFGVAVALFSIIPRIIHLTKIRNYCEELEKIAQAQMNYVQQPQTFYQTETDSNAEEELKKNNPERFMPPRTPEEEYERWRKKE